MFCYEKKEHKKDGHEYIEITGFDGKIEHLVVPDIIDGIKVEAIGNHAFSGRSDIVSISLPETIKTLYGFAFHDCRNLREISLFDSLDDYYDGVCRQCDNLELVEITVNRSWYEVIRNFLADNDKTLSFLVHTKIFADAALLKNEEKKTVDNKVDYLDSFLVFPEYIYDFNENTMARTIQFSIAGAGMFYRECVDRRKIDYRQYDSLFSKAIIDGSKMAENIAMARLLYPVELSDGSRKAYEDFISVNGENLLKRLIEKRANLGQSSWGSCKKLDFLERILSYRKADGESMFLSRVMDAAVQYASMKGYTTITAMLMDKTSHQSVVEETGFFL